MLLTNMAGNAGQFNGLTVKTITMTGAAAAARFRGQNLGFPPGALPNTPVATFGQPTGASALRIVQVGVRYRF